MIRGKISGKFPGEISQKFLLRLRYVGMDTGLLTGYVYACACEWIERNTERELME